VKQVAISIRAAVCCAVLSIAAIAHGADPATIFGMKCSGCHTYGKGEKVGPDLKGVADRRSRSWLAAWIRSSERTIKSGDPVAMTLFKRYKQERMPDQNFSPAEIAALIDYLAAGGPDAADRSRPRPLSTATADDVALGRRLFLGTTRFSKGGASCASCHMVHDEGSSRQATFACDLTHVYSHFQDAALDAVIKQPCFPRVDAQLTAQESFAVRAFLRYVDGRTPPTSARKEPR
jgi:mono/diheme cytochrome c family protein